MLRVAITYLLGFATLASPTWCCCVGDSARATCSPNCAAGSQLGVSHCHPSTLGDCSKGCFRVEGKHTSGCPSNCPCICRHDHAKAVYSDKRMCKNGLISLGLSAHAGWSILLPPTSGVVDLPSEVLEQHKRDRWFATASELLTALSILRC